MKENAGVKVVSSDALHSSCCLVQTKESKNGVVGLPSGVLVQRSDGIDPRLDCFSCSVEVVGLAEDRCLNTTTTVMTHDDNVADPEFRYTVCDDGYGVKVSSSILICDVAFGEENTGRSRENRSFGNSGVAVRGLDVGDECVPTASKETPTCILGKGTRDVGHRWSVHGGDRG